jgi:hypothetical protein
MSFSILETGQIPRTEDRPAHLYVTSPPNDRELDFGLVPLNFTKLDQRGAARRPTRSRHDLVGISLNDDPVRCRVVPFCSSDGTFWLCPLRIRGDDPSSHRFRRNRRGRNPARVRKRISLPVLQCGEYRNREARRFEIPTCFGMDLSIAGHPRPAPSLHTLRDRRATRTMDVCTLMRPAGAARDASTVRALVPSLGECFAVTRKPSVVSQTRTLARDN